MDRNTGWFVVFFFSFEQWEIKLLCVHILQVSKTDTVEFIQWGTELMKSGFQSYVPHTFSV